MKLYELCQAMTIGSIKVMEKEEGFNYPVKQFVFPAGSALKKDYYYADVQYFSVYDSTIIVYVKRGNDNGRVA